MLKKVVTFVWAQSLQPETIVTVWKRFEPVKQCSSSIDSCYRVLQEYGWLLIIDETYPSTLTESRQDELLFPVQTGSEELTWSIVLSTREMQEKLLRDASFEGNTGHSIVGEGFTVLTARK